MPACAVSDSSLRPNRRPWFAPSGMPVKVVDASAVGALLFGEPKGSAVASALEDADLAAPALLEVEISSVCLSKIRLHPDRREALLAALRLLPRLSIELFASDPPEIVLLADETGLTVYDAAYLWLAKRLGADLVTLDRRLAAAARRR